MMVARFQRDEEGMNVVERTVCLAHFDGPGFGMELARSLMGSDGEHSPVTRQDYAAHWRVGGGCTLKLLGSHQCSGKGLKQALPVDFRLD